MGEYHWTTGVTKVEPNKVALRGYPLDALIGRIGFAQGVYLAIKGQLPTEKVGRMMEAMLVSSLDHGATPPSTLVARAVASCGSALNAAVAAGILTISRHHGGAIENCMRALIEADEKRRSGLTVEGAAAELVEELVELDDLLGDVGGAGLLTVAERGVGDPDLFGGEHGHATVVEGDAGHFDVGEGVAEEVGLGHFLELEVVLFLLEGVGVAVPAQHRGPL